MNSEDRKRRTKDRRPGAFVFLSFGFCPLSCASSPLEKLRDIHLPEPVSWWPPAPGWWGLLALLLVIFFLAVRRKRHPTRQRIKPNRYRQEALQAIEHCFYQPSPDSQKLVLQVITILRRCALTVGYGKEITSQSAGPLMRLLDKHSNSPIFDTALIQRLEQLAYAPNTEPLSDQERVELEQRTVKWIKTHSVNRDGSAA